ncbi:MAG: UbiX family flavin prenyltransferase [Halodesulfurarchaeum sp.]
MSQRIVVAMTGATGQIYGITALQLLEETDAEAHLVISDGAKLNLKQETDHRMQDVIALGDAVYDIENVGASPASGSFPTDGMLIAPCSMKTLAAIANGFAENLITRAADVTLKERRPLVLMPREAPFNRIHLENMLSVTDAGGVVYPPFPSFYHRPESIEEMVSQSVAKALTHLDVEVPFDEWNGLRIDVN